MSIAARMGVLGSGASAGQAVFDALEERLRSSGRRTLAFRLQGTAGELGAEGALHGAGLLLLEKGRIVGLELAAVPAGGYRILCRRGRIRTMPPLWRDNERISALFPGGLLAAFVAGGVAGLLIRIAGSGPGARLEAPELVRAGESFVRYRLGLGGPAPAWEATLVYDPTTLTLLRRTLECRLEEDRSRFVEEYAGDMR